jgi:WD40 repeat protein
MFRILGCRCLAVIIVMGSAAGVGAQEPKLELVVQSGHTSILTSVSLSGDGRFLATGSRDNTAILWDTATGQKLRTFTGHSHDVTSVSLSSDGRRLATGSSDGTAIVWDAATGQKLRTFTGHSSSVESVSLSSDGRRLVTGSSDGTTRLWDADTGRELCALLSLDAGQDWLVVTPDGYFDGSPNAAKFLSYRIAGTLEFVPLENYRKEFERPGLLAKILKGEDY